MGGKRVTLVNLYGPNRDDPGFYRNVESKIENIANVSTIICGDWNLVLDQDADTSGYLHANNTEAQREVIRIKEELNLIDVWRATHLDTKRYTWRQAGQSLKQSRLDFFMTSDDIYNQVCASDIAAGYKTDHSLIYITLKPLNSSHGRGFWKFNTLLLRDQEYANKVKHTISETTKQYSIPGQNEDTAASETEFIIDDQLFWETLKMEIRKMSISYSSLKKRERVKVEKDLIEDINNLEAQLSANPTAQVKEQLKEKQLALETLRELSVKATMIRSRARWVELGERPTSYFCNLEKRNYSNKAIPFIQVGNKMITEQREILEEQALFYKELYRSKHSGGSSEYFLQNDNIERLTEDQKEQCEGHITDQEVKLVLKNMSNNKSPGNDGFPAEFFKFFWQDLGFFLMRSYKQAFNTGSLSITQRRGIITCLPKGEKPRQFLKNWRPITLLNVDYKILSACLANRMKEILPSIISSSQKGFLKERFIGENTRLVLDVMQHLEEHGKPGLILLADFEKAFDSIEWPYLTKLLNTYNFGASFSKWFSILYTDVESCVINSGNFSRFFELGRGCRQGDPLSPYIFLLAIEPLAMVLKNNKDIKGIKIGDTEYKVGMYADDTFLLMEGDERSLKVAMETFRKFHCCSGLKLNVEKTQIAWLGERRGSPDQLCPEIELNWTTSFTLLGIKFNTLDVNATLELNLENKITDISKLLGLYKPRNLSIIGKVTVIKTLAIPKLIHLLTVLPNPKSSFITKLNEVFSMFLWKNKKGRINRNLLAQTLEEGGLKLTHLQSQIDALKIRWIRCLLLEDDVFTNIFQSITGLDDCNRILRLDSKSILNIAKKINNTFWSDVLKAWATLTDVYIVDAVTKTLQFSLWDSWYIKSDNLKHHQAELMFWGCRTVADLFDEAMNIISYNNFCNQFMNINFLDYASLVASLPVQWKRILSRETHKPEIIESDLSYKIISEPKTCRFVYKCFIEALPTDKPHELKWRNKGIVIPDDTWKLYNALPYRCTKSTKLQAFQYKITHRVLGIGVFKKICKIVEDDACTFCAGAPETLVHFFVECPVVKTFWGTVRTWLDTHLDIANHLEPATILFGDAGSCLISHVFLAIKYYIFLCQIREQHPCLAGMKSTIKLEYNTEKQIALQSMKLMKNFQDKWRPIESLLSVDI